MSLLFVGFIVSIVFVVFIVDLVIRADLNVCNSGAICAQIDSEELI